MMGTAGLSHWADILTVVLYFIFVIGVGIWVSQLYFHVSIRQRKVVL